MSWWSYSVWAKQSYQMNGWETLQFTGNLQKQLPNATISSTVVLEGRASSCPYTGSDETIPYTNRVWVLEERNVAESRESTGFISWKSQLRFTRFTAGFIDLHFPVMSSLFGTLCVFQAGDKHYHPSCARCSRCNQMFTEGEEMYLQGERIHLWKLSYSTFGYFLTETACSSVGWGWLRAIKLF